MWLRFKSGFNQHVLDCLSRNFVDEPAHRLNDFGIAPSSCFKKGIKVMV
jgi:hypothetical protein